jgi:endogenous inhibitor of DNA gyrase (YacG/DUF329 family)
MNKQNNKIGLRCVKCGKDANKGSMQHPYCEKCFKIVFNNDYNKYSNFMNGKHN